MMIRFEHVTKRLGRRNVLDDCSFEVEKGETFVIVGFSGAGKSVTLKHMVRLLTPDRGHVWVGDDLVSEARGKDLERIRSRFGYLFQSGPGVFGVKVRSRLLPASRYSSGPVAMNKP